MPYEDIARTSGDATGHRHSPVAVLLAFLKLGLISFGGPLAHIGYFREEFVARRRWIDDPTYTDVVALCQFLPGPASSQVGFSIGLIRAGYLGGLAAWIGFTLPSAIALVLFAFGAHLLTGVIGQGLLHGLKLVAVAIVAQAVLGMARTLCPDLRRASIAVLAAVVILYSGSTIAQMSVLVMGAAAGLLICRAPEGAFTGFIGVGVSRGAGLASLSAFFLLLVILPLWHSLGAPSWIALLDAFYRSGALVFGGGHVVLPLLRDAFVAPGWVSDGTFLAGYGAAQAVPGPLFTFAAYLGAVAAPSPHGLFGAVLGLVGIFLPGMLVLVGILPFWNSLRARADAQGVMRGVNAAVVGLLAAALYSPVGTGSINTKADFAVALIGFVLLTLWHVRPLLVVLLGTLSGIALTQIR
jgi:chromate transporter